jgi:hypothetical protein
MAIQPQLLPPDKQLRWLIEHIPHRIRAVLPGLPMSVPWLLTSQKLVLENDADRIAMRCSGNSAWEGRMTAMRWLIMFVGIQEENGVATETRLRKSTDVRIDFIKGGVTVTLSRPEALKMARVWRGCSQATSHPTQDTNHPDVREKSLAEALGIVIDHLQRTIYSANGRSVLRDTLAAG